MRKGRKQGVSKLCVYGVWPGNCVSWYVLVGYRPNFVCTYKIRCTIEIGMDENNENILRQHSHTRRQLTSEYVTSVLLSHHLLPSLILLKCHIQIILTNLQSNSSSPSTTSFLPINNLTNLQLYPSIL